MSAGPIADIRDFYACVLSGDLARAEAKLAPDQIVIREAESLPYGGVYHGVEGYRNLSKKLVAAWKRVRFEDFTFAGSENTVMARFLMTATSRATGIEVTFPVVEIFDLVAGKIVAIQPFYWDTHALRKALGID